MRVYLDNCCLQRPLDDQTQPRIKVETEALFAVLATVYDHEVVLLSSEALYYEVSRIPDETRRMEALAILSLASENLQVTDTVEALELAFEQQGLQAMDTLSIWHWLRRRKWIISVPVTTSYSAKLNPYRVWPVTS